LRKDTHIDGDIQNPMAADQSGYRDHPHSPRGAFIARSFNVDATTIGRLKA
jgi:hypothetical protein